MVEALLLNNLAPTLRGNALFNCLSSEQLNKLLAISKLSYFRPNKPVISQGQVAKYFFLVLDGQVKLHLISTEGKEKIIKFVNSNDTFAEALMFLQKKFYPINGTSTKRSQILAIPSDYFYSLLHNNSDLTMNMLGNICLKMRGHINEIEMLTVLDASQRVARFVYDMMPHDIEDEGTFTISISKKSIAGKLSIRPETFSRLLKKFEDDNVFSFSNGKVTVLQRDRLSEYYLESSDAVKSL